MLNYVLLWSFRYSSFTRQIASGTHLLQSLSRSSHTSVATIISHNPSLVVRDILITYHQVGLVELWDCLAFDEVARIIFKDKDDVQIMKDYMASGSFARRKEEKSASASMGFVANINHNVDVLLNTSHFFDLFPYAMAYDTAFLERMART